MDSWLQSTTAVTGLEPLAKSSNGEWTGAHGPLQGIAQQSSTASHAHGRHGAVLQLHDLPKARRSAPLSPTWRPRSSHDRPGGASWERRLGASAEPSWPWIGRTSFTGQAAAKTSGLRAEPKPRSTGPPTAARPEAMSPKGLRVAKSS